MNTLILAAAVTAIFNTPVDQNLNSGLAFKASLDFTNNAYVWASAGRHRQTMLGQRMGNVETYALGLGWKFDSGFFLESGYAKQEIEENPPIWREAIYHSFLPEFGKPPFADNWTQTNYEYKIEPEVMFRAGYEWDITKHLSLQAAVKYHIVREYRKTYNPNFLVDNAEGGEAYPYWEKESRLNNSSFEMGITYSF